MFNSFKKKLNELKINKPQDQICKCGPFRNVEMLNKWH